MKSFTHSAFTADIDVPEGVPLPSDFEMKDTNVYLEITDDNVNALSQNDSPEESIGMTEEEVL